MARRKETYIQIHPTDVPGGLYGRLEGTYEMVPVSEKARVCHIGPFRQDQAHHVVECLVGWGVPRARISFEGPKYGVPGWARLTSRAYRSVFHLI